MSQLLDLSRELTVFVPTVGAPTFSACMECLDTQSVTFRRRVIDHVAPLSAAYQIMLDVCETPFFVQVDEDMLLYPQAVRQLFQRMQQQPENIAIYVLPLFDEHLGRSIMGIKIYRHAIVSRYPYIDEQSCEMGQVLRMQADGYEVGSTWGDSSGARHGEIARNDSMVMGLHGTSYTPRAAYERYWDLVMKYRRFPWLAWVSEIPAKLAERCQQQHGTETDWWALMGVAAALAADPTSDPGEKNYRTHSTSPGFTEIFCHLPAKDPQELIFYQTNSCNYECSWCRRTLQGLSQSNDITPEIAEMAFNAFPNTPGVCIAGFGEPTLSPHVGEVTELALNSGRRVGLISNGSTLASLDRIIPCHERLASVNISLNAATPAEYDATNKQGKWFGGIISATGELAARMRHKVAVSFVITAKNHQRIPDYLGLAVSIEHVSVNFVNVLPHTDPEMDWNDFHENVLTVQSADYLAALSGYKKLAATSGVTVNCWPTVIDLGNNPRRCRSPWEVIAIDGSGFTYGCRRIVPPFPAVGGDLKERDRRVWTAPHIIGLRRSLIGDTDMARPCHGCFGNWQ